MEITVPLDNKEEKLKVFNDFVSNQDKNAFWGKMKPEEQKQVLSTLMKNHFNQFNYHYKNNNIMQLLKF